MNLGGYFFLELQSRKCGFTYMSKKARVRTPMDGQDVKASERLLKSEQQYFSFKSDHVI